MKIFPRYRGISLVESLIAIILVALVMPIALGAISSSMRHSSAASKRQHASVLADMQLNRVIVQDLWQSGDQAGVFGEEDGTGASGYSWSLEVSTWQTTTLKQLDLIIYWTDVNRQRSYALQTWVGEDIVVEGG